MIAIDEVQFFDEQIITVTQQLANSGYRVVCSRIGSGFSWGTVWTNASITFIAESVTKLQAVCAVCGSPASRTQRLIDGKPASYDEPIILVGASESYEPRCRHHHEVPGKISADVKVQM